MYRFVIMKPISPRISGDETVSLVPCEGCDIVNLDLPSASF
jgi:hypothetical protein